jgi:hypothetical protein
MLPLVTGAMNIVKVQSCLCGGGGVVPQPVLHLYLPISLKVRLYVLSGVWKEKKVKENRVNRNPV